MLARGHKLRIGEVGIVGYVAKTGSPRIALDVGEDAVFFNNPDLPLTKSEMALPIKTSEKILGVLDIQSKEQNAFVEEDIVTLQIIADSLASALENVRLLSELQNNLREIESLHQQYLRKAWTNILNKYGALKYTYLNSEATIKAKDTNDTISVDIPIKLRGQTIGNLKLEFDNMEKNASLPTTLSTNEVLKKEDLEFIHSILEQTAQTLENARLLEETQQDAYIEEIASNITNKIWQSTEIDAILENALQEISKSLKVSEGLIQLEIT